MVWARHEDGRRSRSGESDDESDTGGKERETKYKVEGCVQEGHAYCRTERGQRRRHGLLERDDQQPERRPQMTGTARGKEEEAYVRLQTWHQSK